MGEERSDDSISRSKLLSASVTHQAPVRHTVAYFQSKQRRPANSFGLIHIMICLSRKHWPWISLSFHIPVALGAVSAETRDITVRLRPWRISPRRARPLCPNHGQIVIRQSLTRRWGNAGYYGHIALAKLKYIIE